jgi:hypothetical protein
MFFISKLKTDAANIFKRHQAEPVPMAAREGVSSL